MLAASYWSLLAPAIDMAEDSGKYGSFAFLPVAVGFTLGAAFVYFADLAMPLLVRDSHTHNMFCTEDCKYSVHSALLELNVAGAHVEELFPIIQFNGNISSRSVLPIRTTIFHWRKQLTIDLVERRF